FEFKFLLDNNIYTYGFDISTTRVESEWLSVARGDSADKDIFTRSATGDVVVPQWSLASLLPDSEKTFATLGKLAAVPLRERQLFLNRASAIPEHDQGALAAIIKWLIKDLV